MKDVFREPNDEKSLKQRRVCIALLLEEFNKFFPAKNKKNWERRCFSSLTTPRRMEPLALDKATGTDREQPDSVKESCERNEFDLDFDERMRAKAAKLGNVIRTERWEPSTVSINAPVHVKARAMIRLDKSLGIDPGPELKKIARGRTK